MLQVTGGDFSFDVLVINDGSTDNTLEVVEEISRKTPMPLRCFSQNGSGVAKARNRGIALARGEWIAFFDDDQVAEPTWLKELIHTALTHEAECVGSNRDLIPETNFQIPQNRMTRALLGEELYNREFQVMSYRDLPGTGTSIVRKLVFDQLSGFDESMLRGGSDHEFFRRSLCAGYRIYRTPRALVHHVISAYRLNYDYMKQISLRTGGNFAFIDQKLYGTRQTCLCFIGRIGQAALVHIPMLAFDGILSNEANVLGHKYSIWRAIGYAKQTLRRTTSKDFSFREEKQLFESD